MKKNIKSSGIHEIIYSKFAIINNNNIYLHVTEPKYNAIYDCLVKNVQIRITDLGYLELKGEKVKWGFSFECKFLKDDEYSEIENSYIKYGYKNIVDIFKGIKTPYVKFWYKLKNLESYNVKMSNYKIIH